MAFSVGTISAELEINGQQFIATLNNADEVLNAFGQSAAGAGKESESFLASLLKFELIKFGFDAAIDGIKSLLGFFGEAIEASDAFEASLLSLNVALELRGIGELSDDLQELAASMQDTTQFSQTATFEVSKFLALAGVKGRDLERFTKVVLDFAAATGVSVENAAKQFARTLSGGVGRSIAQYLPAVNALTKDQRKAGDAFELAEQQLGGFAEAIANSSAAIETRFANAVQLAVKTFGDALAPVQDVFFELGRDVANAVTDGLRENQAGMLSFFAGIGQFIINALQKGVDFLIDMPVHIARVKAFFEQLGITIAITFNEAKIKALEFVATLEQKFAAFAASKGGSLFGFTDEDAKAALIALHDTGSALDDAREHAFDLQQNLEFARINGDALIGVAQGSADAIRDGRDQSSSWAKALFEVGRSLGIADEKLQGMVDGLAQADQSLAKLNGSASQLSARLSELRKVTGVDPDAIGRAAKQFGKAADAARDTADAADDIEDGTDRATASAGRLESAYEGVGRAAKAAASSFTTDGGFGEFGADSFGSLNANRQGGTFNLGLDSAAKTQAYLNANQGRLAGLSNIYGSRDLANLQFKKIAELLQTQIREETAAFTTGIIDELNRQGIFDPTQRNALISARFDEARRLGTLPRGATYNASTGSIGSYG